MALARGRGRGIRFSLSLLAAALATAELSAQAKTVHPHIAPLGTAQPNLSRPFPTSPLLNIPDGIWNNGEGFPASGLPDHGGWLDADHIVGLTLAQVHCYTAAQYYWHPYNPSGPNGIVQRFVGYLRLGPAYPAGASVEDAAFEIFAPLVRDPSKPLVVHIAAWATFGTPLDGDGNLRADLQKYPGHRRLDGLVYSGGTPDQIFRPYDQIDLVANPPAGYQVVAAYIVPRLGGRSMIFEMQRYEQLAKVVDLMLAQPAGSNYLPATFTPIATPQAKLIAGGSFGGLTSQMAVMHLPQVFHGAGNGAFSASLRRTMGEQFAWNLIGRRSGMGLDETSLSIRDILEWASWYRQVGWDFFSGSSILRRRRGEQYRPIASLLGDEDTVTCGVDWIPYLSGTRDHVAAGLSPATAAPPAIGNADHYWTIVDRRCHGEGGEHFNPITSAPSTVAEDFEKTFLPVVRAHWSQTQGTTYPSLGLVPDDGSEDPYDALLSRGIPSVPPVNNLLQLDPNFGSGGRTVGHGLCLGADESLKSAVVNGATYVFAGDADGIVHRFTLDAATQSFVEQARSPSLGFGVFALEVAALQSASPPVVIAGTHRHLYQLDALTLQPIPGRYRLLGEFERSRPRRIAVAEVHAASMGPEILLVTFQGQLLVMDQTFGVLTDLGEPGIQDFVVHSTMSYTGFANTTSTTPITLLSHRGHLANVTLNNQAIQPGAQPAVLHCWSKPQRGWPGDLEVVSGPAGDQVVACFEVHAHYQAPVRHFDAFSLFDGPSGGLGLQSGGAIVAPRDLEVVHDVAGNVMGYVVLEPEWIRWIPVTGTSRTVLAATFSPASRPIALEAVDLVASASGEPVEELVISTLAGHLVWFRVSDLTGGSNLFMTGQPRPGPGPHARTNHTLAGTWGLVSRMKVIGDAGDELISHLLYGITQAGELYEVDPYNGASVLLRDVRALTELPGNQFVAFVPLSPIRDLAYVEDSLAGIPSQPPPELWWRTLANQPGAWLHTLPWQNASPRYLSPRWYKTPNLIGGVFEFEPAPKLPIYDGFVAFSGAGAVGAWAQGDPYTGVRDFHWWAGGPLAFPNFVQGAYATSTQVIGNWYTSEDTGTAPNYGSSPPFCKDLRNTVNDANGTTFGMQALRVARDSIGRVIVIGTSGGGIALIRPQGPSLTQHGQILWSSEQSLVANGPPTDDGYGCMALAVRKVPGDPGALDIFYASCIGPPDPGQLPPGGNSAHTSSVLRWVRWNAQGSQQMTGVSKLHLDPSASDPRGGFVISGIAVGDIAAGLPGDELVVTGLDGDLFVLGINGGVINPTPLMHTWVQAALGAYNGLLIDDLDMDLKKELYVASSQGIWKWRQP